MKSSVRKKTYNLDENLIGKVRKHFNARTDTEAIQKALHKTLDDVEIQQSLEKLLRQGRFRDIYR